jgi:hypothetical protein
MCVFEVVGYTAAILVVGILIGRIAFGHRRRTGKHALHRSTIPAAVGARPDCGLDEQWPDDLHRIVRDMRADPGYSGNKSTATTDIIPLPLIAGDEPPSVFGLYRMSSVRTCIGAPVTGWLSSEGMANGFF